jgi:hypothetical protein
MNQLFGMCVFSQSFDWISAKIRYFILLIFPCRQRMVTLRQVLVMLLCWFVLGCHANWDSDDDPGECSHKPEILLLVMIKWQNVDLV